MARQSAEKRRERERARHESDPQYREKIKAQRRAYYDANREKIKAKVAAHRRDNPGAVWRAEIKRKYGLTLERHRETVQCLVRVVGLVGFGLRPRT